MADFTMVNLEIVRGAQAYSTISPVPSRKVTVLYMGAKWICWYKYRFSCFQNRMLDRMADFLNLVFLMTLPKNDRQALKMGCIDASRRQLQSVLKIRV
jgi:hypothetical protein